MSKKAQEEEQKQLGYPALLPTIRLCFACVQRLYPGGLVLSGYPKHSGSARCSKCGNSRCADWYKEEAYAANSKVTLLFCPCCGSSNVTSGIVSFDKVGVQCRSCALALLLRVPDETDDGDPFPGMSFEEVQQILLQVAAKRWNRRAVQSSMLIETVAEPSLRPVSGHVPADGDDYTW